MSMKQKIGFLIGIMTVILSGCGNMNTEVRDSDDQIPGFEADESLDREYEGIINVCGNWGNFEALDEAALLFKAYYPNIEVVYNNLDNYTNDLVNRMATGVDIDLYMIDNLNTDDSANRWMWKHGENLGKNQIDFSEMDQDYLATGRVDGKQVLVPIYEYAYGFAVNKDLLAAYGLEVPVNYEEFLNSCRILKENGVTPILTPGDSYLVEVFLNEAYEQILEQDDSKAVAKALQNGSDINGVLDTAFTKLNDLYAKDFIHRDSYNLSDEYGETILRFLEGDIAYLAYSTNYFSGTKKREAKSESYSNNPFSYDFIPFPGEDGYTISYRQMGTIYFGVYARITAEKTKYVHEFLRFLISQEGNYCLEKKKNMPTANGSVGNHEFTYLQKVQPEKKYYIGEATSGNHLLSLDVFFDKAAQYYLPGMTAEEFLSNGVSK